MISSGCSTTEYIYVTKTVIEKQYPPEHWLNDCPEVELKGGLFVDVLNQSVERLASIKSCNIDKKSIRDWVMNGKNE